MGLYRTSHLPQWYEDELWLRLDEALEEALSDPHSAYVLAMWVWADSRGYPAVRRATEELMSALCE